MAQDSARMYNKDTCDVISKLHNLRLMINERYSVTLNRTNLPVNSEPCRWHSSVEPARSPCWPSWTCVRRRSTPGPYRQRRPQRGTHCRSLPWASGHSRACCGTGRWWPRRRRHRTDGTAAAALLGMFLGKGAWRSRLVGTKRIVSARERHVRAPWHREPGGRRRFFRKMITGIFKEFSQN